MFCKKYLGLAQRDERDILQELTPLRHDDDDVGRDDWEGDSDCSLPGYIQSLWDFTANEQC